MIEQHLIILKTLDHKNIALWKVFKVVNDQNEKHVYLTHGTFSDKKICLGIAKYLASLGYICWIMEWRNHGESQKIDSSFNFETIAKYDIKAVFSYLLKDLKIKTLDCITHSGGGICLTMFLINNTSYISRINKIVMFSCQAFGAAHSKKSYIKIILSKYITYIIGFIPGKILRLGPHNENYYTMKQWFNWNLSKSFLGENKFNYLEKMDLISIPILSICSEGDKFISPKKGCEFFLNAFNNSKNKLVYCSINNGFSEDYNHSRVMMSTNAAREIWSLVLKWIAST
ncbi:alpha/beta fold hydrolase [Aquimarina sp. RZ0]|uniref:alpha/beta fold hydrolase n=1 Tax=Aquimarina sp. RZ0 TaxID=2607730 RepID=UPI0011F29F6A|nr:alpha/beta fold hydrolase [Aquimarina sp. RZ0]KAA1246075.1 alpha/beta hydrolase [Aquimarina sp. RZ0]